MTLIIDPYVAAGPIKFGMKRVEIHALIDQKSVAFKRGGSRHESDHFAASGLLVEYNEALECIAVEIARPAIALYRESDLLNLSFKQVINFLGTDTAIKKDVSGFTSYLYGIGASFENRKNLPESIIVFKKNYYSENDEWQQKLDSVDFTKMTSREIDKFIKQYMKSL